MKSRKKLRKFTVAPKSFRKSLDLTISNPFVGLVKKSGSHTIFPKSYIFCFQGVVLRGGKKLTPLACMHYTRIGVLKTIQATWEWAGLTGFELRGGFERERERQKKTCIVVLMYTLQYNTCSYQFIKPTFCSINRYNIFFRYTLFLFLFFHYTYLWLI